METPEETIQRNKQYQESLNHIELKPPYQGIVNSTKTVGSVQPPQKYTEKELMDQLLSAIEQANKYFDGIGKQSFSWEIYGVKLQHIAYVVLQIKAQDYKIGISKTELIWI